MADRLDLQFAFLAEADRLKNVTRASLLVDGSRAENSAEHSWHAALWAMVLGDGTVDMTRVTQMLLLHDLVEIDVGDNPIHLENPGQRAAEEVAALRIFGILPADQGAAFLALWHEFEAGQTPEADFAKTIDYIAPIFQGLCSPVVPDEHRGIVQDNLATGRARDLHRRHPDAHHAAVSRLNGQTPAPGEFETRLAFLIEADRLKTIDRASRLHDDSRHENSAEHSWHISLYAWVLADQAHAQVQIDRVLQMLVIHDLVEIDAGDTPIHGDVDPAAQAADEALAADRLFGLLPAAQARAFRALWDEFEAAASPDAVFAKAVDRMSTPLANLDIGGGSWGAYNVTFAQLEARVGAPIARGAPGVWAWLMPKLRGFFHDPDAQGR